MSSEALTLAQLVSRLRRLGVTLSPEGERLRARGPVGALTPDLRQAVERRRAELLRLLRPPAPSSVPEPGDEQPWYPLSHNQRQLWFEQQLHPAASHYNVPLTLRLASSANPVAVEQALRAVVRRHATLRARFPLRGDAPVMETTSDRGEFALSVMDWDDDAGPAGAQQCALEYARRPFDLARERPLRACLVRRVHGESLLLITLHHIVADGCSMGILVRDFSRAYAAWSSGAPLPSGERARHYGEFAAWQTSAATRASWKPLLGQARDHLLDVPECRLPCDFARGETPTLRGGLVTGRLAPDDLARLTAVARECGTTLFALLLGAYMILLHHETGQERFAIGSDVAGREDPAWDGVVGHFVNQIVLVADLSGDPTLAELVGRAAAAFARAHALREVPFDVLVSELRARGPLFRAKIVMQPPLDHSLGGTFEVVGVHDGSAKFDLLWNVWHSQGGAGLAVEYDRGLFADATGERFFRHLYHLLEQFRVEALSERLGEWTARLSRNERARSGTRTSFAARRGAAGRK